MSFEKQRSEIVAICKNLLDEGKVNVILGFTEGQVEGTSSPLFMRTKEDVDNLKWDSSCTTTLAKYLLEKKEGVAIIAKPCDARAIVMYMAENQISRDNVYIIGVECEGMADEKGVPHSWCQECTLRTPPLYDVIVKNDNVKTATNADIAAEDGKFNYEEKLARFQHEMSKCILCYSCRQACYGCYCETCFIDRNTPNWLPNEVDAGTKMVFHLGRAMHLAGRCIGCGACQRACPSGVNIRYLVKELADFCKELYGYEPGVKPGETPAMTTYDFNDKEVGFLGGEDNDSCCGSKE
jgi:formate dehydrogenase subunit beta